MMQICLENFQLIFVSTSDTIAPVKAVRVKVLECFRARDKAFHVSRNDKPDIKIKKFKILRNNENTVILNADKKIS